MSLVSISLTGHLFDTHCFNKTIDACEKTGVQFRVLGWDLGMTGKKSSRVNLQIMCKNKASLSETLDDITMIAEKCGVELYQAEEEGGYDGMLDKDILSIEKN